MERMKELVELLSAASRAYYQEDREIMPNYEYDKLYDELCALERETGVVLADSPTIRVGHEVLSELAKVRHETPMLSLDKTKDAERLAEFLGDQEGLLSWKLDGLTIVLTYRNGSLAQAVTRGNGEIGEDVTHNARWFSNIPIHIEEKGEVVVRGEAVISYKAFQKINENLPAEEQYKNPRNLTSGTVRQLNSEIAAKRRVSYFPFSVVKGAGRDFDGKKSNALKWLCAMGFETVHTERVTKETVGQAVEGFSVRIKDNDFASDGLVLTYDSIPYSQSIGATAKFPRDSIAFKWADETAETTLTAIQWNTSRTGAINPIAVFEPVELEGTTVNKASVHNVNILEELALGYGDRILVYKANMIIPQIAENLTRSGPAPLPSHCPVCEGDTEVVGDGESRVLYCTNPNCQAQLIRSLQHFASRDAMNIEGFSIQTIEKFAEKGYLHNYTDIYRLHKHREAIKEMDGFGEKSTQKLMAAIEASKATELHRLIYALGIPQVGLAGAKLLCRHFQYDLERIKAAEQEELINIEGFGTIMAQIVYHYFRHQQNMALLDQLLPQLTIAQPEAAAQEHQPLAGLSFVVTGDVHQFPNRKALGEALEALGGKVTSAVTGKTSFLINNNPHSASSKNKKAKELAVPIITEDELIERFLKEQTF